MVLPLYTNVKAPEKYNDGFNAGLWYDKFCRQWVVTENGRVWSMKSSDKNNPKAAWINTAVRKVGDAGRLAEMKERFLTMLVNLQGSWRVFKTEWRFVTGLGRNHPVENGFAWHATLGVPFLPGSSVKGMVRAWAQKWLDISDRDLVRIFGEGGLVGSVIFFDALPINQVQLASDVMTPHYAEYYQGSSGQEPPADWYSPTPIPFLAVAAGQLFIFAVATRHPHEEGSRKDAEQVINWLEDALTWIGAGAKTAAGYGRFVRDGKAEGELANWLKARQLEAQQIKKQEALADMSPVRQEMEKDGYSENPDRFMAALTQTWLKRLDEEQQEAVRREVAQLLAAWYQTNKPDQWEKPRGKNEAKVKKIKSCL